MEMAINLRVHGPHRTVLVVDNARTVRSIAHCLLSTGSSTVSEAGDAIEALEMLTNGARPDLMLVSDELPGHGGCFLVRAVREIEGLRFTPIVMLASESQLHRQMEWKDAGATCWITKPFTGEQLLQVVELVMF